MDSEKSKLIITLLESQRELFRQGIELIDCNSVEEEVKKTIARRLSEDWLENFDNFNNMKID